MKFKSLFMVTLLASTLATPAWSESSLKIGTGTINGSYYPMGNDIVAFCGDAVSRPMEIVEQTNGSVGNILDMTNKKLHGGFTQIDVLRYQAKLMGQKVNENRMKVVVGLHRESGHLLIPAGWQPSQSGFSGFFSKLGFGDSPEGVSIDLLKDQPVGAWGGSLVSVRALSSFMNLNLKPVEIKPGQVVSHPVLIVAGQPSAVVEAYLKQGWQLVPINAETLKNRASFYDSVALNYAINGKLQAVPSFGVRAVFVAKSSRSKARNKPFSELATCIRESLVDLADDSDTNPNWESVYEFETEDQINWDYFPLIEDLQS